MQCCTPVTAVGTGGVVVGEVWVGAAWLPTVVAGAPLGLLLLSDGDEESSPPSSSPSFLASRDRCSWEKKDP